MERFVVAVHVVDEVYVVDVVVDVLIMLVLMLG